MQQTPDGSHLLPSGVRGPTSPNSATQHLLNCEARLRTDPLGTIARVAGLMGLDAARVRRWLFARLAAEPRENWAGDRWLDVARALA